MGDWDKMIDVGRLQAMIWFFSFICLVNLVMLNMLLAMIMDTYTQVKGSMGGDAETLWSQAVEICTRMLDQAKGRKVSLQRILVGLDPAGLDAVSEELDFSVISLATDTYISVSEIMRRVEGLSEEQAHEVLESAEEMF